MSLINLNDKIFICGHNGMAGSAILRALTKKNYQNILTVARNQLDLSCQEEVNQWFLSNKPDVVILAAAKVGGIMANNIYPTEFLLENLKIQNNVIESAWKNNVKRLLFLGSSCIYPKFAKQPITEDSLMTGELEITNEFYAIAKISGIKLCEALRKQYGFDAISLMPTNLYGPGDNYNLKNSHVLPALIRKFYEAKLNDSASVTCWGTGSPLREFLHVDDLGDACVFSLENWNPDKSNSPTDKNGKKLTFLNVGSGKDISIKGLTEIISEAIDYEGKIIWDDNLPDGTPRKLLDVRQISSLGWAPKIDLKTGISKTIEDFTHKIKNKQLRQ